MRLTLRTRFAVPLPVTRLSDLTARSSRPRRKSDWLRPVMVFGLAPGVFYFLLASSAVSTEPAVWPAPSLERTRGAAPGDGMTIELDAAR